MRTDVHPADDYVEIILGEQRFGGSALRLLVDDTELLLRLTETLDEAHSKLLQHRRTKTLRHPAMSQVDMATTTPVAD